MNYRYKLLLALGLMASAVAAAVVPHYGLVDVPASVRAIGSGLLTLAAIAQIGAFLHDLGPLTLRWHLRRHFLAGRQLTDRTDELQGLTASLEESRIINVFGQRGVGKSSILRAWVDLLNHHAVPGVSNRRLIRQKLRRLRTVRALYFDLSDRTGRAEIDATLAAEFATPGQYQYELAKRFGELRVVIVLDNLNNAGLVMPICALIRDHLSSRPNDVFVLGSIEPLYVWLAGALSMAVSPLAPADIAEFARNHGVQLDKQQLLALCAHSQGLPLYLDVLLASNFPNLETSILQSGLSHLLASVIMPNLSRHARRGLQLIANMSLVASAVSTSDLEALQVPTAGAVIEELRRNSLVTESDGGVKLHDIVRDAVLSLTNTAADVHHDLAHFYSRKGALRQAALHQLLSGEPDDVSLVKSVLRTDIASENVPFLLSAAEITRRHGFEYVSQLDSEFLNLLVHAALMAHLKVGDYPTAAAIAQDLRFTPTLLRSLNAIDDRQQFDLHFLLADLDHLQNRYLQAIEVFRHLRHIAEARDWMDRVMPSAWAIAHSMRHRGQDLREAALAYQEVQQLAHEFGDDKYTVRAMTGQVGIALVQADPTFDYDAMLTTAYRYAANLPELRGSVNKYRAMYLRRGGNLAGSAHFIQQAVAEFRDLGSRLSFNMYFELGEHHRLAGAYASAISEYRRTADVAKRNTDKNLVANASLGTVLAELGADQLLLHKSADEQLDTVNGVIVMCYDAGILITELQARLVREYLRRVHHFDIAPLQADFHRYLEARGLRQEALLAQSFAPERIRGFHLTLL